MSTEDPSSGRETAVAEEGAIAFLIEAVEARDLEAVRALLREVYMGGVAYGRRAALSSYN